MTSTNLAGFEKLPQTLPHYCLESFRQNNKPDALCFKTDDGWLRISGAEATELVRRIALGLSAMGIKEGDRVAIISENRPEWSLTDIALLCLRAVNVPIYTTQAVDQIRFILENSGAKMLFISGRKLYKHAADAIRSVESIERVVFFDADDVPLDESRAMTLDVVKNQGDEAFRSDENAFERLLSTSRNERSRDDHLHQRHDRRAKRRNADASQFRLERCFDLKRPADKQTDRSLAVLPLSHIFERTVFYVLCANGVSINYCSSFDQLASYLQEVKPTIMTAVPRLFEQVYHRIVKKGRAPADGSRGCSNGRSAWDKSIRKKGQHETVPASLAANMPLRTDLCFLNGVMASAAAALLCLRRRAAFKEVVVCILGGRHRYPSGLRHDRGVYRLGEPTRGQRSVRSVRRSPISR